MVLEALDESFWLEGLVTQLLVSGSSGVLIFWWVLVWGLLGTRQQSKKGEE